MKLFNKQSFSKKSKPGFLLPYFECFLTLSESDCITDVLVLAFAFHDQQVHAQNILLLVTIIVSQSFFSSSIINSFPELRLMHIIKTKALDYD